MASARSAKDKAMASYLKSKKVVRATGNHCPFGCGRPIAITGTTPLLAHMLSCQGRRKKVVRR